MSVLKGHMLSYLLQLLTLNHRQVEIKNDNTFWFTICITRAYLTL